MNLENLDTREIVLSLYNTVLQQQSEISFLKKQLSNIRPEMLSAKQRELEESIQTIKEDLLKADKTYKSDLQILKKEFVESQNKIHEEITLTKKNIEDITNEYKQIKPEGTTAIDLSVLIRGHFRDSKRLDGFNELLMTTREESQEMIGSLMQIQGSLKKFSQSQKDFANSFELMKSYLMRQTKFLQDSIKHTEVSIGIIWDAVYSCSVVNHHLLENVSSNFTQLDSAVRNLTTTLRPPLPKLDEVKLEVDMLKEQLSEGKTQFMSEREKFKKLLHSMHLASVVPDVTIDSIEIKVKVERGLSLIHQSDKIEKMNEIEDVRSSIHFLELSLQELRQEIEKFKKQTLQRFEDTVDCRYVDRIVSTYETGIQQMSGSQPIRSPSSKDPQFMRTFLRSRHNYQWKYVWKRSSV
jgi:hypothetical protein